jgi:hypothetical protein
MTLYHGLINYVDTKAKCRHPNKLICKGTLQQVFICLRPPPPQLKTPHPPPSHTLSVYTVLFDSGMGERIEPERRLEGQQFTKLGLKYQHD